MADQSLTPNNNGRDIETFGRIIESPNERQRLAQRFNLPASTSDETLLKHWLDALEAARARMREQDATVEASQFQGMTGPELAAASKLPVAPITRTAADMRAFKRQGAYDKAWEDFQRRRRQRSQIPTHPALPAPTTPLSPFSSSRYTFSTPIQYSSRAQAERELQEEERKRDKIQARLDRMRKFHETRQKALPDLFASDPNEVDKQLKSTIERIERDTSYLHSRLTRAQQRLANSRASAGERAAAAQEAQSVQQRLQNLFDQHVFNSGLMQRYRNRFENAFSPDYNPSTGASQIYTALTQGAYSTPAQRMRGPLPEGTFSTPEYNQTPSLVQAQWMKKVVEMRRSAIGGTEPLLAIIRNAPELKNMLTNPDLAGFVTALEENLNSTVSDAQLRSKYGSNWLQSFVQNHQIQANGSGYTSQALEGLTHTYRAVAQSYAPGNSHLTNSALQNELKTYFQVRDNQADADAEQSSSSRAATRQLRGDPIGLEQASRMIEESIRTGNLDALRNIDTTKIFGVSKALRRGMRETPSTVRGPLMLDHEDYEIKQPDRPSMLNEQFGAEDWQHQAEVLAALTPRLRNYRNTPVFTNLFSQAKPEKKRSLMYRWNQLTRMQDVLDRQGFTRDRDIAGMGTPGLRRNQARYNQRRLENLNRQYGYLQEFIQQVEKAGEGVFPVRSHLAQLYLMHHQTDASGGPDRFNIFKPGFDPITGERVGGPRDDATIQQQLAHNPVAFSVQEMRQIASMRHGGWPLVSFLMDTLRLRHRNGQILSYNARPLPAPSQIPIPHGISFRDTGYASDAAGIPQHAFLHLSKRIPNGRQISEYFQEHALSYARTHFPQTPDVETALQNEHGELHGYLNYLIREHPQFLQMYAGAFRTKHTDRKMALEETMQWLLEKANKEVLGASGDIPGIQQTIANTYDQLIPGGESQTLNIYQQMHMAETRPLQAKVLAQLGSNRPMEPGERLGDLALDDPYLMRMMDAQRAHTEYGLYGRSGFAKELALSPVMLNMRYARRIFDQMRYGLMQDLGSNMNDEEGQGVSIQGYQARLEGYLARHKRALERATPTRGSPRYIETAEQQRNWAGVQETADALGQIRTVLYSPEHMANRGRITQTLYALGEALGASKLRPQGQGDWTQHNTFWRALGEPWANAYSRGNNTPKQVSARMLSLQSATNHFFKTGYLSQKLAYRLLIDGLGHSETDASNFIHGQHSILNTTSALHWSMIPGMDRLAQMTYRPGHVVSLKNGQRMLMAPLVPWRERKLLSGSLANPSSTVGAVTYNGLSGLDELWKSNFVPQYYGTLRKLGIPAEAIARGDKELKTLTSGGRIQGNVPHGLPFMGIPIDAHGNPSGIASLHYLSDLHEAGLQVPDHFLPELNYRSHGVSGDLALTYDHTHMGGQGADRAPMLALPEDPMHGQRRPLGVLERQFISQLVGRNYNPLVEQGYAITRRKGAAANDFLSDPSTLQLINATKGAGKSALNFLSPTELAMPEGHELVGYLHTHDLLKSATTGNIMGWGRLSIEDLRHAASLPGLAQYAYEPGLGPQGGLVQYGDLTELQEQWIRQNAAEHGIDYQTFRRLHDEYGNMQLPSGKLNWQQLEDLTTPYYRREMAFNPEALAPVQSGDGSVTGEALRGIQTPIWKTLWQRFGGDQNQYARLLGQVTGASSPAELANPDVRAATPPMGRATKGMPDPDITPLDLLADERTPEQNAILMQMAQHSRFALNAGPGVGKTTLMGHWYLSQLIGEHANPSQMRILTQNNQAAFAFNNHLRNLAGRVGYKLGNTNPAATIHRYARALLWQSQGQGSTAVMHMLMHDEGMSPDAAKHATPASLGHIIQGTKGFARNQFTLGYNLKDDPEAHGSREWILAHELHRIGAHVAGYSPGVAQQGQYALDLNDLHHAAARVENFYQQPVAERLAAAQLGMEHLNRFRLTPNGVLPESSGGFSDEALFALYHHAKRRNGLLDWHDVMRAAATAVQNPLGSFLNHRDRILPKYIGVDETNDLDVDARHLISTLGDAGAHLLIAGDPNQTIFSGTPETYLRTLREEFGIGPDGMATPTANFRAQSGAQVAAYNAALAHVDSLSGQSTPRMLLAQNAAKNKPLWGGRGTGLSIDTRTRNQITAARQMATHALRNIGLTPEQVAMAARSGELTQNNWDTWYRKNAKNPLNINDISKQTGLLFQTNSHLDLFRGQLKEMGLPAWMFLRRNADNLKELGADADRLIHYGTIHSVKGGEFNHAVVQVGEGPSGWGLWADNPLVQAMLKHVAVSRGALSTRIIAPRQMLSGREAYELRKGNLPYQIGPHDELALGSAQHAKLAPEQDTMRAWRPIADEYIKQALLSMRAGAPVHEVASHLVSSGMLDAASPQLAQAVHKLHRAAQKMAPHTAAAQRQATQQQQATAAPVAATVPINLNNATITAQTVTVTPAGGATAGAAAATAAAVNAAATGAGAAGTGGTPPPTAGAVAAGGGGFTPPPGVPVNLGGYNNPSTARNGGGGPGSYIGGGRAGAWGRGLARVGWEVSYLSQVALQNAQNELMVSDQYRIPAAQQSILAGMPITPAGISPHMATGIGVQLTSPFANQYKDFSVAQLQGAQANYASTFGLRGTAAQTWALQSSPLFNHILQTATLGNMSPEDVTYYLSQISAASSGMKGMNGTQTADAGLGSLLALSGGDINGSNIAPLTQAYTNIAPLAVYAGQNAQDISNVLGLAQQSGATTPSALIAASQGMAGLYQAGINPSTSAQYGLLASYSGMAGPWWGQAKNLMQSAMTGGSVDVAPLVGSMTNQIGKTGLQLPDLAGELLGLMQKQSQIQQLQTSVSMNVPMLQISATNAQISLDNAQLGAAATQLQYGWASYNFNLNRNNQLYGPIGADTSRTAYFDFLKSSAAAGYDWTNAQAAGKYAPVQTFGLKNAEFYAGVENSRQQLVLGRSKLTSDLAFQQQMKYLNQQENFYTQEIKLQNEQRQFEKTWQAKLLESQGAVVGAQAQLVKIQEQLAAAQIPVLQWEAKNQPIMLQLEKDQLAAMTAKMMGGGPGPLGGYLNGTQILQKFADAYKGQDITQIRQGLSTFVSDPTQVNNLAQMVQTLQLHPGAMRGMQNSAALNQLTKNFNAAMGGNTTAGASFAAAQSNATLGAAVSPSDLKSLSDHLDTLSNWIEKLNETIGGKMNTVTGPLGLLGNVAAPTLMSGASILNILSLIPGFTLGAGAGAGGGGLGGMLGGMLGGGGLMTGLGAGALGLGVPILGFGLLAQLMGNQPGHGGNGMGNAMDFLGNSAGLLTPLSLLTGFDWNSFGTSDQNVLTNFMGYKGASDWSKNVQNFFQPVGAGLQGQASTVYGWGQNIAQWWNGNPDQYQQGGGGSKMISLKVGTEGAKQKIGDFFSNLGTQTQNGMKQVGNLFSGLGSSVQGGIKNVGQFFSNVGTQAQNGKKALGNIWSGLSADVQGAIKTAGLFFSNLGSSVQGAIKNVQNIGSSIVSAFTHINWGGVASAVGQGLSNVMSPQWWQGVFGNIQGGIANVFRNMNIPAVADLGYDIGLQVINYWNKVADLIQHQFHNVDWHLNWRILGWRPYATGGFTEGWSLVGEHGAELIRPPVGSQVLNHETTLSKLAQMVGSTHAGDKSGATSNHTLTINVQGNKHTLTDADIDCLLEKAFKVLKEELQS